ncbi:Periplasmic protein Wza involved in polysaccharide export [Commensalibacter communis]|nr:Periplasmic protein Wza involved in polysaccharide export [Commensalibacter communis]
MMIMSILRLSIFIFLSLIVSGCSLPRGGPSSSSILSTFKGKIITVDEYQAQKLDKQVALENKLFVQKNLDALMLPIRNKNLMIKIGDKLIITLMSFSPDSIIGQNQDPISAGFDKRELGTFTVDYNGNINLPYIGNVYINNLTESAARNLIQSKYNSNNSVVNPYVIIALEENGASGVTVTGDIGAPKILSWQPGGMKLATALTLAQNGNTRTISNEASKDSTNKTMVNVIRNGAQYSIPYDLALKSDINLAPSDKIIVKSAPQVRTTLIGGGILKNGIYDYSSQPALLDAIARAGGFNPNNADISNVFVFRKDYDNDLKIYRFKFNDGHGMAAAAFFPIFDKDVIFSPESPIVPWLRVLNIAFQMALPAAIIK